MRFSLIAGLALTACSSVLAVPLNPVGSNALDVSLLPRQTNESGTVDGGSSGSEDPIYGIPTGETGTVTDGSGSGSGSGTGTGTETGTDPGTGTGTGTGTETGTGTGTGTTDGTNSSTTPIVTDGSNASDNTTTIIPNDGSNNTTLIPPSANGTLTDSGAGNSTNSTNSTLGSNGINEACGSSCATSDSVLTSCWNSSKDPEVVVKCFCGDSQGPSALSACTSAGANCGSTAAASLSQACSLYNSGQLYEAGVCYASQNPSSSDCQGMTVPASPLSGTSCQSRPSCSSFEATLKSCVGGSSAFVDGATCLFTSPNAYNDLSTCLEDSNCLTDDMAMIKAAFDTYNSLNGPSYYSSSVAASAAPTSTASGGSGSGGNGASGGSGGGNSGTNNPQFISIVFQSSFCMTSGSPKSEACTKPKPVSQEWQRTYQEKSPTAILAPATTTKKTASITEARGGNFNGASSGSSTSTTSGAFAIRPCTAGSWILGLAISAGFAFML